MYFKIQGTYFKIYALYFSRKIISDFQQLTSGSFLRSFSAVLYFEISVCDSNASSFPRHFFHTPVSLCFYEVVNMPQGF